MLSLHELQERDDDLFEAGFRKSACSTMDEFETALLRLCGKGSAAERADLRKCADRLIRIVARVMIRTESSDVRSNS
jgi:hypothetical protein